jgi:ferredoxin
MRAAAEAGIAGAQAVCDRQRRGLRVLPPVRGRDRGPARHARLLHDAGGRGHGRPHPGREGEEGPARRDGALYLRPPARLPDLCGQWRLRVAGHGRCRGPARCALRGPPERRLPTISRRATPPARRTPSGSPRTTSNPYFTYDPSKCIVCSRCVRACEEVQGTFALTIEGRGFDSRVSAGMRGTLPVVGLRQLRRLRAGLPDGDAAGEIRDRDWARPTRSVVTTCAYCGVGCSFKAELNGDELVRMVPYKHGKANRGHSCVKGRFAWGYANHAERILNPMIRETRSTTLGRRSAGRRRCPSPRPA